MEEITNKKKAPDFAGMAKNVAQRAANGAKRVHQAFGGEYGDTFKGNVATDDGEYILPEPIIDDRECEEIDSIAKRYEKMTSPGVLAKAGKKAGELAPAPIKEIAGKVGKAAKDTFNGLTEQELMAAAVKKAAEGFGELEKQAAKASVSKEHVIQCINAGKQEQKISDISEICLLRAYDIAAVTAKERPQHMGIAFVEGGGTGAAGFWGLPANLALSMLIYFRAVQSVAMFYGYDVKEDPAELVIASEVFQRTMSPSTKGNPATDYIGKVLLHWQGPRVRRERGREAGGQERLGGDDREGRSRARHRPDARAGQQGSPEGVGARRQEGHRGRRLQEDPHADRPEADAQERRQARSRGGRGLRRPVRHGADEHHPRFRRPLLPQAIYRREGAARAKTHGANAGVRSDFRIADRKSQASPRPAPHTRSAGLPITPPSNTRPPPPYQPASSRTRSSTSCTSSRCRPRWPCSCRT